MVGILPDQFWDMGLPELYMAVDGCVEFNAAEPEDRMDKEELHKLMELYPD